MLQNKLVEFSIGVLELRRVHHEDVIPVGNAIIDQEVGHNTFLTELDMRANNGAQKQIPCPCYQQSGWEAAEVSIVRGEQGVFQIATRRIHSHTSFEQALAADQHVVNALIENPGVTCV